MNKTATALIICFILLSSILTIGIFPKIDFLPVLAKKVRLHRPPSSNTGTTPSSGGQSPSIGTSKVPAEATSQ